MRFRAVDSLDMVALKLAFIKFFMFLRARVFPFDKNRELSVKEYDGLS